MKKIEVIAVILIIFSSISCFEGLGGLVDEQPRRPSPPSLVFVKDTDFDEDQIAGLLNLIEPEMEDDISSYRVYWGNSGEILGMICSLDKGTASLEYLLPIDTPVPPGATHFIAQSVTSDGILSVSFLLDIEDVVIRKIFNIKAGDSSFFAPASEFYIVEYNGFLYFNGGDKSEGNGAELWRYDGVNAPVEFIDINLTGSSFPDNFTVYNNRLYFSADGGDGYGRELWCYDGLNIARVSNINTSGDSLPSFLKVFNNNLYFSAESSWSRKKLFMYNGVGEPVKVCDINSAASSDDICCLEVFNGKLYFQATNGSTGKELWSFDGSVPAQVADINTGFMTPFSPHYLCVFNDELYFSAEGEGQNHGSELWAYNGSGVPYEKFDVYPGYLGSTPKYMTVYNGRIYFQGVVSGAGAEILCSDGTGPPFLFADINGTSTGSLPECFTEFNGKLYFYIKESANRGIWTFYIK